MMTRQILFTGHALWQGFSAAIRPVFFDTGIDEWRYASHGGTLFVVECLGRAFSIAPVLAAEANTVPPAQAPVDPIVGQLQRRCASRRSE
jgi:hypothetical protein